MANTVSILSYANTFGDWVVSTNALAKENNDLAANNYVKPTGTLYLNDPSLGLQVANSAIVAGQLQVQGIGSSAYIQNNLRVDTQVYFTNTSLGLTNSGQANIGGLLLALGSNTGLIVANNANINGSLSVGNTLYVNSTTTLANTLYVLADGNFSANTNVSQHINTRYVNASILANAHALAVVTSATVGGSAVINNNVTIGNNLITGNNLSVTNNTTIGANTSIGAHLTVANNLTVGSNTVLGGTLTVSGNTNISSNISTPQFVNAGNLNVNGLSTTQTFSASSTANVGGNLGVTGSTFIGGNNTVSGSSTVQNNSVVNGALTVAGAATVGGQLAVTGNFIISGSTVYSTNTFTLNSGSAVGLTSTYAVNRGTSGANAAIRWNETSKYWDIRDVDSLTSYSKILTANLISDSVTSTSTSTLASSLAANTLNNSINSSVISLQNQISSNSSSLQGNINTLNNYATAAYNKANTGGAFSGDVSITGNLIVNGTTTTINTNTIETNDSLIKLANNNIISDTIDIGFFGTANTGSRTYHGLVRQAGSNFFLFKNLPSEPVNNILPSGSVTAANTATLRANLTGGTVSGLAQVMAVADGGTNSSATPTAGGIAYGNGTQYQFMAAGVSGQVPTSAGAGAPTWTTATNNNTASAIVQRDASGNFSAGTITATLSGTATQVSSTLTRGTYLTGSNFNGAAATTWAVDADSNNTASKVVVRDASGNFAAGTITASLSGTATTATNWGAYGGIPTAGVVPPANGIPRADASGYMYFGYINSNTANGENPTVSQVLVTNGTDNFFRKSSISSFTAAVQGQATGTWGISVTGNAGTSSAVYCAGSLDYRAGATAATAWSVAQRDASGNLTANIFSGTATKANYADLAEKYTTDKNYITGTVVVVNVDGESEGTISSDVSQIVLGVVSEKPAFLMNEGADGQPLALRGRVPVRVVGPVKKGDTLVSAPNGVATVGKENRFGVALETNLEPGEKLVEVVIL